MAKPTPSDGDDLRGRYRRVMAVDRPGHLQEADWDRLACGEMKADERERALEHVTSCAACADVYRGLSMLGAEAPTFDPDVPRPRSARRSLHGVPAWARWAAAGLTGAALLSWGLIEKRSPAPSVTRAPAAGARLALLEPLGPVSQGPVRFRWSKLEAAESYRVRVFTEDGLLLWTSDALTEPRAEWPAAASLAPGRYFWDVEAFREGSSVAGSELQAFVRAP